MSIKTVSSKLINNLNTKINQIDDETIFDYDLETRNNIDKALKKLDQIEI